MASQLANLRGLQPEASSPPPTRPVTLTQVSSNELTQHLEIEVSSGPRAHLNDLCPARKRRAAILGTKTQTQRSLMQIIDTKQIGGLGLNPNQD